MLEAVGVSPIEEAVYRALLSAPRQTVAELARRCGHGTDAVRRATTALERLGLASRVAGRPVRLIAARPDVAVDALVARRREELGQVRLEARRLLSEMPADQQHRPDQLVEILAGRSAVSARFAQLLQTTREELLVFDRPPYAGDYDRSNRQVVGLLNVGTTVRGVYTPESMELPGALEAALAAARLGEQSRMHPAIPMKLAIFDRRAALLPLVIEDQMDSALVVHSSALLDALVALFELVWQLAVPLAGSGAGARRGRGDAASRVTAGMCSPISGQRRTVAGTGPRPASVVSPSVVNRPVVSAEADAAGPLRGASEIGVMASLVGGTGTPGEVGRPWAHAEVHDDSAVVIDSDQRLLTLLAAGLKDEAIARQLGVSTRTVSRRVADMLDVLNSRTRFQAGVMAQRQGWLAGATDE
ncbi:MULTISPECIES: helix-turn-helix transcriptional regulator [Actinoalloteichus]|uniref:Transcriptional regulator n=1 Tax=Actinoalloteichus fjordicus TaxID=1612552 RepID=A0AAC9LF63_9PSEU|nr:MULTISPECIES: LuxR family transcriptional regulator [Actinoalloteichus]APU16803.1 putative transcriptional regulator [Actinoalloteichus fjordicus]APU22868.1 putative transcriptional regulator [Actinoalloteichus sp. GBA129-24]